MRVNLTNGKVTHDTVPQDVLGRYVSGEGLGTGLIVYAVSAGVGPLEPENRFSITTRPLTAAPCLGASAFAVEVSCDRFHTPGLSMPGFLWGELNAAGFDAILRIGCLAKD